MNKTALKRMAGKTVRLLPQVARETEQGEWLPPEDDYWRIQQASAGSLTIYNLRTGHIYDLGCDNVIEFRSPDFLMLRCQLTLKGIHVLLEPKRWSYTPLTCPGFPSPAH